MIRHVKLSDAGDISRIYNEYVENSRVTFEEKPVSVVDMRSYIQTIIKGYPWIVFEETGQVVGYTYANRWKDRSAYRFTVETGIYIDPNHHGNGIGTQLKGAIISELREGSFHSVISGIALPNPASIALCKKFGFEKVGHFKEMGLKLDQWVDVVYWQLLL